MRVQLDVWQTYATMFSDDLELQNAAPLTIKTYSTAVAQLGAFLRERGMPHDPTSVTREHLTEWMRHLQRPRADGGQGLSAQTALQRYRSVSRLFAYLVRVDEIRESPMAKMLPPRVAEKLVPVIGAGDLDKLFDTVKGQDFESRRDRAIMGTFIDCGFRIGEMAGIRLDDVDFEGRVITVTGKGSRERRVRFVRETRGDLQRYLLRRHQHPDADTPWLWLGRKGRLTTSGIYRMIVRRCDEAGVERVHPHQFRHTFAHAYLAAGGNEGDLMQVTGWKSRSMIDRYGASVAAQRAADAHDLYSPRSKMR